MNKTANNAQIKLLLTFSLLFSCATYHPQAQAGAIKKTVSLVIAAAIIYKVIDLIAFFPYEKINTNANTDPDIKVVRRTTRRIIATIDSSSLRINNSIKENFNGLDINKYRSKLANIITTIFEEIGNIFFGIIFPTKQKNEIIKEYTKFKTTMKIEKTGYLIKKYGKEFKIKFFADIETIEEITKKETVCTIQ